MVRQYLTVTEGVNGTDLRNNVDTGTDIVFSVRNPVTGETQDIVLLDARSGSMHAQWKAYLDTLGLSYTGA